MKLFNKKNIKSLNTRDMENNLNNTFDIAANEIIRLIFLNLTPRELIIVSNVCLRFSKLAQPLLRKYKELSSNIYNFYNAVNDFTNCKQKLKSTTMIYKPIFGNDIYLVRDPQQQIQNDNEAKKIWEREDAKRIKDLAVADIKLESSLIDLIKVIKTVVKVLGPEALDKVYKKIFMSLTEKNSLLDHPKKLAKEIRRNNASKPHFQKSLSEYLQNHSKQIQFFEKIMMILKENGAKGPELDFNFEIEHTQPKKRISNP